MRKLFLFVLLVFFAVGLSGQSVFNTLTNLDGISLDEDLTQQVSLNNAYIGSTFSYELTNPNNVNFSDNFLFNANIVYNIMFDSSSWNLPLVGNFDLNGGQSTFDDFELGIFPFRVLSKSDNGTVFVFHSGFSYSIEPAQEQQLSPQVVKILLGLEVSLPLGTNSLPLTISLAPTYENFNLERDDLFGIDGTVIFPIAPGLAVLGDLTVPFDGTRETAFAAGVIVNGAIGGRR